MKKMVLFLVSFGLIHCSPQEQGFFSSFELVQKESSEELVYYSNREGSEEYIDRFSSDKLDLIFILDSQANMKDFYKNNIFGSDFLKRFENYDWRLAYTNTGVNSEPAKNKDSSCGFGEGLLSSVVGVFIESPFLLTAGAKKISGCFSSKDKKGTNGQFLSFEYNGKVVESMPYLTKDHQDYQTVFDHTFQTVEKSKGYHSNDNDRGKGTWKKIRMKFDAPQEQKGESQPLIALALSLFRNQENFFREDSQVVYVIVTPEDAESAISTKSIREEFDRNYKNGERLHVISAVITEEFPTCLSYMESLGISSARVGSNITKFSQDMDADTINICSQNVGEQLSAGIKKYLHPTLSL